MINEVIESLGLINFALLIVGVSLIVIVILFMSYFRTLISIANYSYPNAKFRARGTPLIKKETVDNLLDIRNYNELLSQLKEKNYNIPKEVSQDIEKFDEWIDKHTIEELKSARETAPEKMKPFVDSWLLKYDVKMIKKVIKGINKGLEKDTIRERLYPVKIVDEELINDMINANNMQELVNILKDKKFGHIIQVKEWDRNFFLLDTKLDKFSVEQIKKAVYKTETEDQSVINYFVGKYIDILNLKIIIRGLNENIDKNHLKKAIIKGGRELPEWKLENMIDSESIDEAMVELEGTSYQDIKKDSAKKDIFKLETYLLRQLLNITSKIANENILTVGPLLRFLVGKEIESKNLRILHRGIHEGIDPRKIRDMVILEDYT